MVRATYSEDGAVLLDINKGLCYGLNPVAARIWVTLEGIVYAPETHFHSMPRPGKDEHHGRKVSRIWAA